MNYNLLYYPYQITRLVYEWTPMHRNVIEEVKNPQLQDAYARCRQITRQFAKTFYLATRFLPREKQRSIFAIYALCRYLDNIVDEAEDLINNQQIHPNEIGPFILNCKEKLIQAYDGQKSDNPIFVSLSDVLKSCNIPMQLPLKLIDGVCMDLTKKRYDTFDELYDYAYKVASVVGLMTSEVFGYSSKDALKHAVDLGIAMQLTNILRDVGEDLKNDRIYLPSEDLHKYDISEDELKENKVDGRFIEMMKFQIDRTRKYYLKADKGIPLLARDSRLTISLARFNYCRILDRIEENNYQVFDRRAYLTTSQKLKILPKIWWKL